jgi:mRNA interferase MazF
MPNDRRVPEAGDIGWIDFDPIRGHEQAGRRPALVLTPGGYHRKSTLLIVCPITRSGRRNWPFKIELPDGLKTQGSILVDQIRTVDRVARSFSFVERAPARVIAEARGMLASLLQIVV